ncbi:hypothetical protein [Pedobacter westerhofensis]|nr:hypothetical protein [Pedobacter westerhofensis]
MNKKKMYIIILAMLTVVLGLLIRGYLRSERYFLSHLPEKYKSYPAINENTKGRDYKIIPLFTGARPRAIYRDTISNNIIIESVEEFEPKQYEAPTYSITYYRINKNGEALDNLNETGNTAFGRPFNGHMLYEDGYNDYFIKGKSEKMPYKNINKDLAMSTEELSSLSRQLLSQADAVTVYEEDDPMTYIMSINGEVLRMYIPKTSNIAVPTEFEHNFKEILPLTDYSHRTGLKHYAWENPQSAITVSYFLKQRYQSGTYFSMAAAPTTRLPRWYGIGYFQLKIGTDILKFKHPISYFLSGDSSSEGYYHNDEWGTLDLFTYPMSAFNILTVGFNNNHFHKLDGCYLVVPLANKK